MFNIKQFNVWEAMTWQEMLDVARNNVGTLAPMGLARFEKRLADLRLPKSSTYQQFCNCPVDGAISQGWKDKNLSGPLFQEALDNVMALWDDWTPAEYLLEYNRLCIMKGIPIDRRDLGRGLRNLPSFLREYLLADLMSQVGCNVSVPTADLNASHHVDLILHTKSGSDIAIWSYLASGKSLDFLPKKALKRGRIMTGYNLLAPIWDSDTYSLHQWYVPTPEYVRGLINAAGSSPESYSASKMAKRRYYEDLKIFIK